MSKIFFDANILLDILLPSRPNHTKAMSAYGVICQEYKSLATSENILTTIEYIASKNGCDVFISEDKGIHKCNYVIGLDDVLSY